MQAVDSFHIVGIGIRTTNENEQSAKDIPVLWNKFLTENIANKIPNKSSNDVYCVYTEYDDDYTKPYTAIVGYRVSNLEVPDGFKGITIEQGNYEKFTAKGNLMLGIVWDTWINIWKSKLNRAYATDFEVYGINAQDPKNAEVDIFVGTKA
ncbi:effector binding domain-containing protein [Fulvivirgaceae bacterium BMA10]|uniref:Effector binding domain-containing protein n=1 Tax=Splendidivirga corallicola TaxID=3051826 RepID=A0ABT8KJ23_9BACT|nr:effector binding domain-containing protein [Fulvivirgaceae bacterium BMA10]